MVNTLFSVIRSQKYDLETLLDRIRYYHASGQLTTDQMEQLMSAARVNARNAYELDTKAEILALWEAVHELQRQINPPDEPDEPGEDDIPEYVQPTGAHDAYNTGDRVRFNGKVYECKMDNCVWNPEVYPAGWEEIL